jgi:hypothetical protein
VPALEPVAWEPNVAVAMFVFRFSMN